MGTDSLPQVSEELQIFGFRLLRLLFDLTYDIHIKHIQVLCVYSDVDSF